MISKLAMDVPSADWAGLDLWVMLLSDAGTYAPSLADEFVADVVPASNEVTASGYARQACTGLTAAWSAPNERWEFTCDDVSFPSITLGEGCAGFVFFVRVTNDADSWIVRADILDTVVDFESDVFVLSLPAPLMTRANE